MAETNGVLEVFFLEFLRIFCLDLNVMVEVFNDVIDLFINNDAHVSLDFWFEVVETIQKAPNISFEGPTKIAFFDKVN